MKTVKPLVTPIVLGICVLLFAAQHYFLELREPPAMPAWLEALHQGPPIWLGEVWRHLGCIFLHGGILHLVMNGMALWYLGRLVETVWGRGWVLGLLLISGVAAAALQWIVSGQSVGISGGIMGLVGFLWALKPHDSLAAMIVNRRFLNGIVMIFVIGFVINAMPGASFGIANTAHAGGLGMGYLLGKASVHSQRRILVPAACAVMVALVVGSIYMAVGRWPTVDGRSVSRMKVRRMYIDSVRGAAAPNPTVPVPESQDPAGPAPEAPESD